MSAASLLVFLALVDGAPEMRPPPKAAPRVLVDGEFVVQHDSVDTVAKSWDSGCGPLPAPPVAKRGERVLVATADADYGVKGAGRDFGSTRCEGENPSLAVVASYVDGNKQVLRCRSTRVVRGTEETEHTFERLDDGRIKILARSERRARVRRYDCHVIVERHTVLVPAPKDAPVDEAIAAPPPPADAASIERALAAELAKAAQEAEMSTLAVTHVHAMSDDFDVVEARYVLDGRELKERGRSWPMMRTGEERVVFQDVIAPGAHVLELEFVYLTKVNGAPAKLRVKDAAFFDVAEKKPARLVVTSAQEGTLLTPVEKRTALRYSLNGKPVAK